MTFDAERAEVRIREAGVVLGVAIDKGFHASSPQAELPRAVAAYEQLLERKIRAIPFLGRRQMNSISQQGFQRGLDLSQQARDRHN